MLRWNLHQDVFIGIGIIIIAMFLYSRTFVFVDESAMYPQGLLVILILLAVLIIVSGIRKTKRSEDFEYKGDEGKLTLTLLKPSMAAFIIIVIYVGAINILGFFVATFLFAITFLWFMGVRKWQTYVYTSLGLNLFIYLLFVMQLNVRLPSGIFF